MGTTWFTSDLHLGHRRIPELSQRPFDSIEEHDWTIAANWVTTVRDGEIVWVTGDASVEGSFRHALAILADLPGRKRLIMGNHDRCWVGKSDGLRWLSAYHEVFEVVLPWARAKLGDTSVLLSHFPYAGDHTREDRFDQYRLRIAETPLVHGHTHSTEKLSEAYTYRTTGEMPLVRVPQIHVGVDAWDYAPVASYTLEKLIEGWDPMVHDEDVDT